jgi:hypothetical protein
MFGCPAINYGVSCSVTIRRLANLGLVFNRVDRIKNPLSRSAATRSGRVSEARLSCMGRYDGPLVVVSSVLVAV